MISFAVYCNATAEKGFGHLGRCISISEKLVSKGHHCTIVGQVALAFSIIGSLDGLSIKNIDDDKEPNGVALADKIMSTDADVFIIDDNTVDHDLMDRLAQSGKKIIVIDDDGYFDNFKADVLVNFNFIPNRSNYSDLSKHYILGVKYFPIRTALEKIKKQKEMLFCDKAERVLVSIGGGDVFGKTLETTKLINGLFPELNLRVVLRPQHRDYENLLNLSRESGGKVEVFQPVADLADLYMDVDTCVLGGGVMKYEAIFLSIPCLLLPMSDAERTECDALKDQGIVAVSASSASSKTFEESLNAIFFDANLRCNLYKNSSDFFPESPGSKLATEILQITTNMNS